MGMYFVAETKNSIENASKAIIIEAKNLNGAKIKATKLWEGNPDLTFSNRTKLILGNHIDVDGRIDHVSATKDGTCLGVEPTWRNGNPWD